MVRNVHERVVAAPADLVGRLLDGLGRPGDRLWPPRPWTPIRFEQPLAVGVRGRHGPIRYTVTDYAPGRRVECTFTRGTPARGTHTFDVTPLDDRRALLRHEMAMRPTGWLRAGWPLVVRWLHDALLEELLDRAEDAAGTPPVHRARRSPWVRLLLAAQSWSPGRRNRRRPGV